MKIKIKNNASSIYLKQFPGQLVPNLKWSKTLKKVEGMTIDVETEYLFVDQFNTVPIPGVSELGLRIMEEFVESVIDDERPGKARCNWCGKVSTNILKCEHCLKSKYLEIF